MRKQQLKSCEAGHEQRRAGIAAQLLQAIYQINGKRERFVCATKSLRRRSWFICRKLQHRGRAGELLFPIRNQLIEHVALQPFALPHGIVAILNWQRWKRRRLFIREGFVKHCQLVKQDGQRPTIARDVVHREHENVIVCADSEESRAQQRAAREIKRSLYLFRSQLLTSSFFLGRGIQLNQRQRN